MKRFYLIFSLLLVVFVLFTTFHVFAQVPIGIGPGNGKTTPLGFIEVLAVAGAGYAIKKLHDRDKE